MSISLELSFDAARFQTASARISKIDGPLFVVSLDYVAALDKKDPEAIVAAAEAFERNGRYALAIHGYRTAAVLFMEQRQPTAADETVRKEQDLVERLRPREIETSRFFSEPTDLSDREREIARLASNGLSNQQIATDLVLSIRTVESHVYHALRKLGLSSRHSLRYYREKL
jgi:DNA-binding NarL/FixJ family response regulator